MGPQRRTRGRAVGVLVNIKVLHRELLQRLLVVVVNFLEASVLTLAYVCPDWTRWVVRRMHRWDSERDARGI